MAARYSKLYHLYCSFGTLLLEMRIFLISFCVICLLTWLCRSIRIASSVRPKLCALRVYWIQGGVFLSAMIAKMKKK